MRINGSEKENCSKYYYIFVEKKLKMGLYLQNNTMYGYFSFVFLTKKSTFEV